MKIVWTKLAYLTYKEILDGLKINWTMKELGAFKKLTDEALANIKNERIIFSYANKKLDIRKSSST